MPSSNSLTLIGHAAASAYRTHGKWLDRLVESLTFPDIEQLFVRRQISFDFTRPSGLEKFSENGRKPIYLVPLSLTRRWPPRIGIDLRSGKGKPLSVVRSGEADAMDMGLLIGLAEQVIGEEYIGDPIIDRIQSLTKTHPEGVRTAEEREKHERNRVRAYYDLLGIRYPAEEIDSSDEINSSESVELAEEVDPELGEALRNDEVFSSLARSLIDLRVLWVPVTARAGERCLVKFTFDVRRDITHNMFRPSSYAWVGLKIGFDVPDIGRSGSYHLDIAMPPPLLVKHARLELREPDLELGESDEEANKPDPDRRMFGELSDAERQMRAGLIIDERPNERHGTFYVEGDRNLWANAYVNVSIEKEGYVRGALTASAAVLAMLLAFRIGIDYALEHRGPAVTMLLFVPGLLGYLIVRSGEHWLGAGFLSGVRKLVVANASWPLVGAAALLLCSGVDSIDAHPWLERVWAMLLALSGATTVILFASSYLPTDELWLDNRPRGIWVWLSTCAIGAGVGVLNSIECLFPWWTPAVVMVLSLLVVFAFSRPEKSTASELEIAAPSQSRVTLPAWLTKTLWLAGVFATTVVIVNAFIEVIGNLI
jgi:hypothetical protein